MGKDNCRKAGLFVPVRSHTTVLLLVGVGQRLSFDYCIFQSWDTTLKKLYSGVQKFLCKNVETAFGGVQCSLVSSEASVA